jgi:hypothetical protein
MDPSSEFEFGGQSIYGYNMGGSSHRHWSASAGRVGEHNLGMDTQSIPPSSPFASLRAAISQSGGRPPLPPSKRGMLRVIPSCFNFFCVFLRLCAVAGNRSASQTGFEGVKEEAGWGGGYTSDSALGGGSRADEVSAVKQK